MGDTKLKVTKNTLFISFIFMFFAFLLPRPVLAAEVEITAVPGLGGLYKIGSPVEIKINVDNDEGPAITGNIQVLARGLDNRPVSYLPVYRKDVKIPANANFNTTILISGELASSDPNLELWVNNERLAVTKIQGTVNKGGAVALALGEKILQGGFISWAEKLYGSELNIKYLPPQDIPKTYFAMSSADIIVVDREATALLNQVQANGIKEWVKLGGCLILSEGAGTEPGGVFEEFSSLIEGEKVADLIKQEVGRGILIFSYPALGSVPAENKVFWEYFTQQLTGPRDSVIDRMHYLKEGLRGNSLTRASSYLPQLKFPSVPGLAVFWIIYLFVVGPLTYIILRRFDLRDWSWAVIPALAVIAALGVFLISPSQKLSAPIGQTLAVVDIIDQHLAEVRGAGSFITVKGGAIEVTSPPEASITPVNNYSATGNKPVVINLGKDCQNISYDDIEYWSMRQAALYTLRNDFGEIEGTLRLEGDRVVGKLKNNTKMDLRNCRIQVAQRLIDIGKLSAGEERSISERLEKWPLMNRWGGIRNEYTAERFSQRGVMIREEQMLSSSPPWRQGTMQVEFIGWSDQDTSLFKIQQTLDPESQTDLTLVRQYFRLELPSTGVVKLPPGIVPAQVIDGGFIEQHNGVVVEKGAVTFEYNLSELFDEKKIILESVYLNGLPELSKQYSLQIFNWKNNVWEILNMEQKNLSNEALTIYLSPEKQLRIKLSRASGGPDSSLLPPALSVKGVVQ
ncbi:hypothetical protein [Desulfolucanica intricata]|uniref:hypothetical protein n=1 Tax=Desulfolucanica intricata TaxID=1285191 RepID=UPI0008357575|nr:hypothetical protein [Desulfolucanica intricata]